MDALPAVAGDAAARPSSPRSQWRRTWVVVGVALLVALAVFVVSQGSTTIFYVVMSWFAALAMEPAVSRLTRWMPRAAATAAVMLGFLLAVVAFLWAFGALLVDQLAELFRAFPDIADEVLAAVNRATGSRYTYEELASSTGISVDDITAYADDVAIGVLGLLAAVLSTVFGLFVVAFFVFYISAGMPSLRAWLARRIAPGLQVPFLAAWDLTRIKVGGYIAARIVLAAVNTVASGIVFALLGLPYWLPLALWTGIVAQFIPTVGTYVSIALPVIVGLTSGDPMLGVWVLVWGIAYQQFENLTIEPRISARAVAVHPAVSFGSTILGAQLFGVSGALLAVPVAATGMAMLEIYQRRYDLTPETEARVAVLVSSTGRSADGDDAPVSRDSPDPAPPDPAPPDPSPPADAPPAKA